MRTGVGRMDKQYCCIVTENAELLAVVEKLEPYEIRQSIEATD